MVERREYPRISKHAQVVIRELAYPIQNHGVTNGKGQNIGPGGMRLYMDEPMATGTLLELKLDLSGIHSFKKSSMFVDKTVIEPLTVIGKVVWCDEKSGDEGYEVGVAFLDIYEDDQKALEKYVEAMGQ